MGNQHHIVELPTSIRLLRVREVMRMTSLSRSYIYALASGGNFPRSISLVPGGTSRAWLESEVQEWLRQRVLARGVED